MQELYPWLESSWESCKVQLENDRVPGSILLLASHGLGVEQLLGKLSSALMCVNYESEACGFCHSCELMKSGSHPDLHRIVPEKEGKSITVDQIRSSNRWAQESSHLDGYRLIIIDPADAMNEAASNALLKTLEEPADKCIFILVSSSSSQLMPTIVSRCQQWKVTHPDINIGQAWLEQQVRKSVPSFLFPLNNGMPISALAMVEDGGLEQCQAIFDGYLALANQSSSDLMAYTSLLNKQPGQHLVWLWHFLVDTQKCHFNILDDSLIPASSDLAKVLTYQQSFEKANSLLNLIEQLKQHPGLNSELLIMNWLIKA